MPNVATMYQMEADAQYQREGVARAVAMLRSYAPFFEIQGDGLTRLVTADLSTTVTAVKASAGNLYSVTIISPSDATADAYVQVFNVAAASVTLGTTAPDLVFKCPFGKTVTFLVVPGDDDNDQFSTAISHAATTTATGSTALGTVSLPDVAVLYA